jgi:hypothetical protein
MWEIPAFMWDFPPHGLVQIRDRNLEDFMKLLGFFIQERKKYHSIINRVWKNPAVGSRKMEKSKPLRK